MAETETRESFDETADPEHASPGEMAASKQLISLLGGIAGIGMFIAGLALAAVWHTVTHRLVLGLVIGGNVLFALLVFWNRSEQHASAVVRGATQAYMVFLNASLLAGALVFVNLIAFNYAREPFDWTRDQAHTIDSQTVNMLKGLERPIKILVLYSDRQSARFTIEELLDLYRQSSSKVDVEYIDPYRDRTKARELSRMYPDVSFPGIIIEYGTGEEADHIVIKDTDLFSISSDFEGAMADRQVTNKFKGEAAITSAISQLTEGKKKVKIYFTTGYGQLDLNDSSRESDRGIGQAKSRLESLKWDVAPLDLAQERQVPSDATLVVVPGPKQALPEAYIQTLRDYMDRGGRMIVLADFEFDSLSGEMVRTGLEDFLASYDVTLGNNRILEAMMTLFGEVRVSAQCLATPAAGNNPIVEGLSGMSVEFGEARTVRGKSTPPPSMPGAPPPQERFRATTLLETSKNAWAESDLKSRQVRRGDPGDEEGPVPVALAVTESKGAATPPMPGHPPTPGREEPRMVVVGDADFLANAFYTRGSDAFFLNSVNWLRGRLDLLGIPPKEKKKLMLEADANPWRMALRPIGFIVAALFVMGVTVWIVRHRF